VNSFWQIVLTIIAQVAVALYVYGQLTERVRGQGLEIRDLKAGHQDHGRTLVGHERRISHIEGRKGIALGDE